MKKIILSLLMILIAAATYAARPVKQWGQL